jgi:hypothetical protein
MDDFRVDSVSPYASYDRQESTDARDRRKPRRAKTQETGEDEVVLASEQPEEDCGEPVVDSYSPSGPPRNSE